MNILYDGFVFESQPTGGISRYFAQLIGRLPATVVPTITSFRKPPEISGQFSHPNLRMKIVDYRDRWPHAFWSRLATWHVQRYSREAAPDIIHPTYYTTLADLSRSDLRAPVVLTVYDMIHDVQKDLMDPSGEIAAMKKAAFDRADQLICISESTRLDVIRFHPELEAKTCTIHLSSDFVPRLDVTPAWLPSDRYLLYVGHRPYYKNFATCLSAFAAIASEFPELSLLCVGGGKSRPEHVEQMEKLGIADRVVVQPKSIPDEDLQAAYSRAAAFVYPSTYEGFGIPLVEAMRCGTPVVAADTPCFREIAGDAGLLVPATDVEAMADALRRILSSDTTRDDLIRRGHARAEQFSWDRMTEETLACYTRLAQ